MKGLIYKDALVLWTRARLSLLAVLAFLSASVISASQENGMVLFCLMYAGMFLSVLPVQLFSFDRMAGWNVFCGTLPLSTAQIVTARYVVTLFLDAVSALWVLLLSGFVGLLGGNLPPAKTFVMLAVILCIALCSASVLLPLQYRFGNKGRLLLCFVVGAMTALCGIASSKSTLDGPINGSYLTVLTRRGTPFWFVAIIGCCILFAVSWRVSIKLYRIDAA